MRQCTFPRESVTRELFSILSELKVGCRESIKILESKRVFYFLFSFCFDVRFFFFFFCFPLSLLSWSTSFSLFWNRCRYFDGVFLCNIKISWMKVFNKLYEFNGIDYGFNHGLDVLIYNLLILLLVFYIFQYCFPFVNNSVLYN